MRKVRYWTEKFLIVFGFIWLLLEPAGLFFKRLQDLGWNGYISIFAVAIVGTYTFFRPKKHASASFPESNTALSVKCSNILDQQGSIVIAVSDTFDTEIGDIISKKSLLGQFLVAQFNGDSARADTEIAAALAQAKGRKDKGKQFGKSVRYRIGTVAPIPRGDAVFFLLAMNKMRSNEKRVETDLRKVGAALDSAWDCIRSNGHHREIHIPLVGTHFGRTGLTPMFVAQLIVNSFLLASRTEQIGPSLTIHVHASDSDKLDFDAMQSWLTSLKHPNG